MLAMRGRVLFIGMVRILFMKKNYIWRANERHIASVKEYFRHRSENLLVLNVGQKGAYGRLCDFLGKESAREEFPWENKT